MTIPGLTALNDTAARASSAREVRPLVPHNCASRLHIAASGNPRPLTTQLMGLSLRARAIVGLLGVAACSHATTTPSRAPAPTNVPQTAQTPGDSTRQAPAQGQAPAGPQGQ